MAEITIEGISPNSAIGVGERRRVTPSSYTATLIRKGFVKVVATHPAPAPEPVAAPEPESVSVLVEDHPEPEPESEVGTPIWDTLDLDTDG